MMIEDTDLSAQASPIFRLAGRYYSSGTHSVLFLWRSSTHRGSMMNVDAHQKDTSYALANSYAAKSPIGCTDHITNTPRSSDYLWLSSSRLLCDDREHGSSLSGRNYAPAGFFLLRHRFPLADSL